MKKLRIAIIGCGGISTSLHAPAYLKFKDVEIVATCDIILERAINMAKMFGLSEELAFANYKDVLNLENVDAVDICTPNFLHSIIAVDAFKAGKNVFCEKPDAISPSEAQKMIDASVEAGKLLMVMRNNRFTAGSQYAHKFIADGRAGDIYIGKCAWQRRRGIPGKGGWFTTKEQSGGGSLIDLGVHMIDLALYLMGSPTPVSVTGCTYCKFANEDISDSEHAKFGDSDAEGTFDVEDIAMGFIRFSNGACLQIEVSWASNVGSEKRFVEIYGTKAGIKWENEKLDIFSEDSGVLTDMHPNLPEVDGHGENLRNFTDVLLYGKEPIYTPEQGINMIKILDAIYKSAETGKEVII